MICWHFDYIGHFFYILLLFQFSVFQNFIFRNLDKIHCSYLSGNINAISILERNLNKINWYSLCGNINAISILEKNLDKINWSYLSSNINAISLLEKNLDKINWSNLCYNDNAISIFEKNQDKVHFCCLSQNKSIYTYDYEYYRKRMDLHREELMKTLLTSRRRRIWCSQRSCISFCSAITLKFS